MSNKQRKSFLEKFFREIFYSFLPVYNKKLILNLKINGVENFMILENIKNSSRYYFLGGGVKLAFKYLAGHENKLENLPAGKEKKFEEKFFETPVFFNFYARRRPQSCVQYAIAGLC